MMLFEAQNDSVKMKLYMTNVSGTKSKQEIKITQISGMMLLKFDSLTDTTHAGIK